MDVNSLSPTKRRSQTDGKENKVSHGHSLVPLVYNSSAIMQWCEPPNKQWDVEVDDSLTLFGETWNDFQVLQKCLVSAIVITCAW